MKYVISRLEFKFFNSAALIISFTNVSTNNSVLATLPFTGCRISMSFVMVSHVYNGENNRPYFLGL